MERKTKRIILVGQAASGKDYLAGKFIDRGYRKDISLTTRPMRDGEIDGLTYHYVSKEQFMQGLSDNKFYEHVEFNGWMYGTSIDDWNNADVFIMTPSGIATIKEEDRKDCVVVFIEISEEIRRQRMDLRSDADTTERRIKADRKDFKGFIDYDYRINDPHFNANAWINTLTKAAAIKNEVQELHNT
jgi:guanylate kinase